MTLGKTLKRHRGWLAIGAVLIIGAVALVLTRGARGPAGTETSYTTEAAARGTLSVTVDGTGYLAVRDEVDAYPDVSGDVADVHVDEGDKVEKGDVLYTLDDNEVAKEVASTKAAKKQASQSLDKAELELYRAEVAYDRLEDQSESPSATVSSSDLEIASKEVAIAKAGVSSAEANYASAKEEYDDAVAGLGDLEVTAPCDGIVWAVNVEEGDAVNVVGDSASTSTGGGTTAAGGSTSSGSSSEAPVTVARDGLMGVELSVNEVDVTTIEPGQDAEVLFDAVSDLRMTGTVDEVAKDGTIESGVVSYSVWLTLDGTDKRLKTGMSASATVVTLVERDVLLVPNAAVKTATDGTYYVQVLGTGATSPTDVTVTTGAASATQTVIESGIDEGAQVVTKTSTTTSESEDEESDDSGTRQSGTGIMMMGAGGPPAGGPGGQ